MLLKKVLFGQKFRFLVDLEEGETVDTLPVYQLVVSDVKVVISIPPETRLCCYESKPYGYPCLVALHKDAEVEVVDAK